MSDSVLKGADQGYLHSPGVPSGAGSASLPSDCRCRRPHGAAVAHAGYFPRCDPGLAGYVVAVPGSPRRTGSTRPGRRTRRSRGRCSFVSVGPVGTGVADTALRIEASGSAVLNGGHIEERFQVVRLPCEGEAVDVAAAHDRHPVRVHDPRDDVDIAKQGEAAGLEHADRGLGGRDPNGYM